jgi:hypothetical protein
MSSGSTWNTGERDTGIKYARVVYTKLKILAIPRSGSGNRSKPAYQIALYSKPASQRVIVGAIRVEFDGGRDGI